MSIENNPAIEVLNTVVTTKSGDLFILIFSIVVTLFGIIGICVYIVDWIKRRGSMKGFGFIVVATILFCMIIGITIHSFKHPVEIVTYEVKFTDPDHFSLTEYEKLQDEYVISREGKIYTLKRVIKDD